MAFQFELEDPVPLLRPPRRGLCVASDRIVLGRLAVARMFREPPDHEHDSGWRFLASIDEPANGEAAGSFELYDVETIAARDPAVIPYLDEALFSAFDRQADGFQATDFPE